MTSYRICSRCIMDTSDPNIRFDAAGTCNHCGEASARLAVMTRDPESKRKELADLVATIRAYRPGDSVTVTWIDGEDERTGDFKLDSDAE